MQTLLAELQSRLEAVLQARLQTHRKVCSKDGCKFGENVDRTNWLAQGSFNIVVFPNNNDNKVHRYGFYIYNDEECVSRRLAWTQKMRDKGIGAYESLSHHKIPDWEAVSAFAHAIENIFDQNELQTLQNGGCCTRLERDRDDIVKKAKRSLKNYDKKRLSSDRAKAKTRFIYLFCSRAKYASCDLQAFLKSHREKTSDLQNAWRVTYNTISKYTDLFAEMLRNEAGWGPVLDDLKPENFLVYEEGKSGLNVLMGDADLFEDIHNAPANRLSLRSLEMLSDQDKTLTPLPIRLAIGVFISTLAIGKAHVPREAFLNGVSVFQDILSETSSEQKITQTELFRLAIASVANLSFRNSKNTSDFLRALVHYVADPARAERAGIYSNPHALKDQQNTGFAQLHDLGVSARPSDSTVAVEKYLDLLVSAYQPVDKDSKKSENQVSALPGLLKALQDGAHNKTSLPEWIENVDIAGALCDKLRARTQSCFPGTRAQALWRGTAFWAQSGRARRTAIATFFFSSESIHQKCSTWSKILYENQIGVAELRHFVSFSRNDSDRVKRAGAPEALFVCARAAAHTNGLLACYTQPDDNGTLAEYLLDSDTAALAWQELFVLMQRYAQLYLRYRKRNPPLLGKWDPSHVAVYRSGLLAGGRLQLRFLEPLLFAAAKDNDLVFSLDSIVDQCQKLAGPDKDPATHLATAFYLTLLLNGMTYFASSEQRRSNALAPLIQALTSKQFNGSWKESLLGLLHKDDLLKITNPSGRSHLSKMVDLLRTTEEQKLAGFLDTFWKKEGSDFSHAFIYKDLVVGEFLCLLELYYERTDCLKLAETDVRRELLRFDWDHAIDKVFSRMKAEAEGKSLNLRSRLGFGFPTCTKFICFIDRFCTVKRLAPNPADKQKTSGNAQGALAKEFEKLRQPYSLLPGGCLWAVRNFIYQGAKRKNLTKTDADILMYVLHTLMDARAGGSLSSYDVGAIRSRLMMDGLKYAAKFDDKCSPPPAGSKCTQCANCKKATQGHREPSYDADNGSEEDKEAWARVAPGLPAKIQELDPGFRNYSEQVSIDSFYQAMNHQGFQLSDPTESNAPPEIQRGLHLCRLDVTITGKDNNKLATSSNQAIVFFWHVSETGEMSRVTMGSGKKASGKLLPACSRGFWWPRGNTETFLNAIQAAINACDRKDFRPAFDLTRTYINTEIIPSDTTGWEASVKFKLRRLGAHQLPGPQE